MGDHEGTDMHSRHYKKSVSDRRVRALRPFSKAGLRTGPGRSMLTGPRTRDGYKTPGQRLPGRMMCSPIKLGMGKEKHRFVGIDILAPLPSASVVDLVPGPTAAISLAQLPLILAPPVFMGCLGEQRSTARQKCTGGSLVVHWGPRDLPGLRGSPGQRPAVVGSGPFRGVYHARGRRWSTLHAHAIPQVRHAVWPKSTALQLG